MIMPVTLISNPDFSLPTITLSAGTAAFLTLLGVPKEVMMPFIFFGSMFAGFLVVLTNPRENKESWLVMIHRSLRSLAVGGFAVILTFGVCEFFIPIDAFPGEYVAAYIFFAVVLALPLLKLCRRFIQRYSRRLEG